MADLATAMGFLANGIVFGSILALAAVGLSLVYGILRLSNFAHGDFLAFGAFASLLAAQAITDGTATVGVLVAATLLGAILTVGLVLGLEFAVWRPLRRRGGTVLTLIIVSIGIGLVVRNALLMHFGGGLHAFDRPTTISPLFLGIPISHAQRFTIVAAAVLIAGLHAFLRYTRTGKSMRAVADNIDLARACGINVDRVIVYVWSIAGVLAAVAGVLFALVNNNTMNVNMGFGLILPLFAAVILGGIGSPYGAILGGLIVGVGMKLSVLWLGTEYEFASAFAILILVLILRPTGILGVRQ